MLHGFTSEAGFALERGSIKATAEARTGSGPARAVLAARASAVSTESDRARDERRRYSAYFRRIVLRGSGFQLYAY
ncbi:hypothetical protein [Methylobacterium soli]|uniref:Uncharacterized protein n=1 Tax=Methylobacterium soli TaxID=553447 RepID=A0A6L3T4Q3_9HYPH|nr:hypothetical protein [Methylobacterium soli]KAB1079935.1 hypothetical protein F6X53_09310 [Methylobacterium soli]